MTKLTVNSHNEKDCDNSFNFLEEWEQMDDKAFRSHFEIYNRGKDAKINIQHLSRYLNSVGRIISSNPTQTKYELPIKNLLESDIDVATYYIEIVSEMYTSGDHKQLMTLISNPSPSFSNPILAQLLPDLKVQSMSRDIESAFDFYRNQIHPKTHLSFEKTFARVMRWVSLATPPKGSVLYNSISKILYHDLASFILDSQAKVESDDFIMNLYEKKNLIPISVLREEDIQYTLDYNKNRSNNQEYGLFNKLDINIPMFFINTDINNPNPDRTKFIPVYNKPDLEKEEENLIDFDK